MSRCTKGKKQKEFLQIPFTSLLDGGRMRRHKKNAPLFCPLKDDKKGVHFSYVFASIPPSNKDVKGICENSFCFFPFVHLDIGLLLM